MYASSLRAVSLGAWSRNQSWQGCYNFQSFYHPAFHGFSQSTQNRRLRQKLKEKDQSLEDVDSEQWREEIFEGGKVSFRLNYDVKSQFDKRQGESP